MPELIDMKLPKKTKEELKSEPYPEPSLNDQEMWPYGLRVSFAKDQITKMPSMENLKVGDRVMIQGEGSVTEIRISERHGGEDNHNIELQIEKVSVEPLKKKKLEELSPKEYRAMRETK